MEPKNSTGILEEWAQRVNAAKLNDKFVTLASVLGPFVFGGGWTLLLGEHYKFATVLLILGAIVSLFGFYQSLNFNVDLSKLKGASPFGPDEGDLLSGLHRDVALTQLKQAIATESVAVILLIGPRGVGKTSLISAGLRNLILGKGSEPDSSKYIQIEGNASSLDDIRARVPQVDSSEKVKVVVIDDADLVEDQDGLITWLRSTMGRAVTLRKLILVLDKEEYEKKWGGLHWPPSRAPRMVFLERFEKPSVAEVARALGNNANLRLRRKLLREIIVGASVHPEGRISPLALSVIVHFIGERGARKFGVKQFIRSGYAAGILGSTIESHLSRSANASAQIIHQALAHYVASGSTSFKIDDLRLVSLVPDRVLNVLNDLCSPSVHVLRANQTQTKFTVLDEWVPSLRAWSGNAREREISCLSDYLENKYDWWQRWQVGNRGLVRFLGRGHYLLRSRELSKIAKAESQIVKDPLFADYIDTSRRYRAWRRVIVVVVGTACIALALFLASKSVKTLLAGVPKTALELPSDFSNHSSQLSDLSVGCVSSNLKWLPRELTFLEANCDSLKSLEGVPPNIIHLGLSRTSIDSLDGIPASVKELDISSSLISKIEGLNRLRPIKLYLNQIYVPDMAKIPDSVKTLTLAEGRISKLDGLPRGLTELELRGSTVQSLKGLPSRITALGLIQNTNLAVDFLPAHLKCLETTALPRDRSLVPPSLETLILEGAGIVTNVPNVRNLKLSNTIATGKFPMCLESLKFTDESSAVLKATDDSQGVPFLKLPPSLMPEHLQYLKIPVEDGTNFDSLPKNLWGLDLADSVNLRSLAGLNRNLIELDISNTAVENFKDVPDSVLTLRFESCSAKGLSKFPESLEHLYLGKCSDLHFISSLPKSLVSLDIHNTLVAALPLDLPKGLKFLNISNTKILGHLPTLPPELEELVLHKGQVNTLEGLPRSVKKLHIVDPGTNAEELRGWEHGPCEY